MLSQHLDLGDLSRVGGPGTPAEATLELPPKYWGYTDVLEKKNAESFPLHQAYNCPTESQLGTKVPFGQIYSMSRLKLAMLQKYFQENLTCEFICKSTSRVGPRVVFIKKKDSSL